LDDLIVHCRMQNAKLKMQKQGDKVRVLTFAFYIFNFAFSVSDDHCPGEVIVCGATFDIKERIENA
jgi:hypothetical protein